MFDHGENMNRGFEAVRGAPRVYIAAFGKHPGWNDHMDDIGLVTESLVEAKRSLYVQGVASQIESRACEALHIADGPDYRAALRDSYTQLLLERLWELLSQPVQSADELKKLTVIAEKMKSLDRDKDTIAELKEEQRKAQLNQLFAGLSANSAATSNP